MAMGKSSTLYVANTCPSSLSVYDASKGKLLRSIANGLDGPLAIAISP
jgi:hypothetical protein